MTIQLTNPHPFSERILLYGGGGAGKTNTALNIISHMKQGDMYVVEQDYSLAYERALATDFPEVEDRVHVHSADPDWLSFIDAVEAAVSKADPEHDWLVIDPVSGSWDQVQEWSIDAQYGNNMTEMLLDLRKQFGNDKRGYAAALADAMNWQLCKKEYARLWKAIQRWKGHLVLIAEAKALSSQERDDEAQMLYGPLGFKPVGNATLKHVASTTLFLDHPKRDQWRITTVKDRNRIELDKEPVEDFGLDYLQGIAGWTVAPRAKVAKTKKPKLNEAGEG